MVALRIELRAETELPGGFAGCQGFLNTSTKTQVNLLCEPEMNGSVGIITEESAAEISPGQI